MTSDDVGLTWIVLSPVAILTDVTAIGVVFHYKPFYHGSDIMVISLLVAMAMNVILVVPIPAFIELEYFEWSSFLCKFYVWAFFTFRIAQMFSLCIICFHWSAIIKASSNNRNKGLTYRIKFISVFLWILSTIIGILPIIGAVPDEFFENQSCMFLTSDMGIGYTIFTFVFVVTCMITVVISICDVAFITKCMKKTANIKYGASRFHLPNKRAEIPGEGSYSTQDKIQQINFTWDLCRFFCIVISFCFIGNHLPFAILEFMQSTTGFNRALVREIILWLILIEALVFPHLLWSCSRRYRHALVYTWRVYILRRPREEEDPMSCRLQSYSRKVRDVNGYTNTLPVTQRIREVTHEVKEQDVADDRQRAQPNTEIVLQPIHNGKIQYSRPDSESPSRHTSSQDNSYRETKFSTFQTVQTQVHSHTASGGLHIQMAAADLDRSHSGGSRQEWKEQMRKKHLPPIFTNDSFTTDSTVLEVPKENILRSEGASGSVHSLYYLSSDYHPDFLNTDSLPRHRLQVDLDDSDSDIPSVKYNDGDINNVLDNETITSEFHNRVNTNDSLSILESNVTHHSQHHNTYQQEYDILHEKGDSSPSRTQKLSQLAPVSADEIDIYIYQAADEAAKSSALGSDNVENRSSEVKNSSGMCSFGSGKKGVLDVREPAEGYNEEDDNQNNLHNNSETAVYHDSLQHKVSDDNWNEMVEPILKKNEIDELDVSLTSCDPTWQHLRNGRLGNGRPVSHSPFDAETDKGFEEALSVEYESVRSLSSLTSDSFGDSINVTNPFEFGEDDFKNESFKTQAIVSKSRPGSCSTVESDNPFDYVTIETRQDVIKRSSNYLEKEKSNRPSFSTFKSYLGTNTVNDNVGDVYSEADNRNIKTSTPNTNCPWPTISNVSNNDANGFESNFNTSNTHNSGRKKKSQGKGEVAKLTQTRTQEPSILMDVDPVFL